ncbi:MAG: hypothetical protein PHC63_06270 [Candidatus Bathyarchaeota archaeon]|nr:hypothetical protein [Candidatus Bathyarchaeota archaeon]
MKEKQKINQKRRQNMPSFFDRRATSVLETKVFGVKSRIIGGVC